MNVKDMYAKLVEEVKTLETSVEGFEATLSKKFSTFTEEIRNELQSFHKSAPVTPVVTPEPVAPVAPTSVDVTAQ